MNLDIQTIVGGPLEVNTYVIGCEHNETCVVIDPGAEVSPVAEAVGSRKVTAILLTHAHFDHMLFADHWIKQGAKLYIHKNDVPGLSDPSLNLSHFVNASALTLRADTLLQDGDTINEAGLHIHVLHTPGHTPGGVCYHIGNALFSGDTLFYKSYGRLDFPGGNLQDMITSIRRLMKLDQETIVYPGHGIKTKIAWERRSFR